MLNPEGGGELSDKSLSWRRTLLEGGELSESHSAPGERMGRADKGEGVLSQQEWVYLLKGMLAQLNSKV